MPKQFNLSHSETYYIIDYNYISIMDGGGCSCENCGKLIANMVTVACSNGKRYIIGTDCAKTLTSINKNELEQTELKINALKRFYKKLAELIRYGYEVAIKRNGGYFYLNTVSREDFLGRPFKAPYIKFQGQKISEDKVYMPIIEKYIVD